MRELNRKNKITFESKKDAFEFLVQESQNQALKEQWGKELDLLEHPANIKKEGNWLFIFKRIMGKAVALLLLLVGGFYWYYSNSSLEIMASNMLDETYIAVVTDSYTRGVENSNEQSLIVELQKEINIALEQNDYDAAIGLFLTKEKQVQLSLEDKFYFSLAISKVEKGDYYKAIRMLEDVTTHRDKFFNESLWIQGLLYIKTGNPNNSKIILNRLANTSNYQNKNVLTLLERIDE